MKRTNRPIPGIGHRVKSVDNPDQRVELVKAHARKHFGTCKYLNYALEVEKVTTKKKGNLILNVDGCIAMSFLDLLYTTELFDEDEIENIFKLGSLNGLFLIGRSLGIIGHVMDQKRLSQNLYRHPWDDIIYMNAEDT